MPSKRRAYRISPLAEADLEDIWVYTFKTWSIDQADSYHADIVAAFEALASGRRQGRRADIREGYFKLLVGSHVIYFRIAADDAIEVIRVLHQRMDTERHL